MGLGGLADHERGDEGFVEGADEGVGEPLGLLFVADGEVDRLGGAPELDERRDGVHAVGVLMGLRARLGEGPHRLELTGEFGEVRAVAQGDDGAARRGSLPSREARS